MSDDDIRERVRRNMERLGIPKGTDHPTLLALGATPLQCSACMMSTEHARWCPYHPEANVGAHLRYADGVGGNEAQWIEDDQADSYTEDDPA